MRKLKLAFAALAVLMATAAVSPKPANACRWPVCDILCLYYPNQTCFQDECCQLTCCDTGDPTCWTPCG